MRNLRTITENVKRVEKTLRALLPGVLSALTVLQLSGCTVGPKYRTPTMETPAAYKEVGDWKPAQPNDQNLGGSWWEIFQDPQLNALEQQVDVSNQNLKAAEAQYTQARAAPLLSGRLLSHGNSRSISQSDANFKQRAATGFDVCGHHLQRFCVAIQRFLRGRRLGPGSQKCRVLPGTSASQRG